MRIWVVNPFDDIPGEGSPQRYWTLCQELARRGHDVTWWSSRWSHRRKEWRQHSEGVSVVIGDSSCVFSIHLVDVPLYHRNVGFARLHNHRKFAQNLKSAGDMIINKGKAPHLVLFSWPPMEIGSVAIHWRNLCRCRVVIDLMDAWPENFMMIAPKIPGVRRLLHCLLRALLQKSFRALQKVDAASAQSIAFADFIHRNGGPRDVHVCYLGGSMLQPESYSGRRIGILRVLYLGAMGSVYDLETLLYAIGRLRDEKLSVRLELAGEGEHQQILKLLCNRLALNDRVTFHGYCKGEVLCELLAISEVGVIPMSPDSMVAVPYKVGDYLGAGMPVISSLPGELKSLIADAGCGRFYIAGDVESLASALRPYIINSQLAQQEKSAALSLFKRYFDRNLTYPQWVDWLECL